MNKKVAIVDDHTVMRGGFAQLMGGLAGYEFCWDAEDAREALSKVEAERPDILVTDITLPGRNGLELIKDVLAVAVGLPILVVSMHDETTYAQRVLRRVQRAT